MNIPFETLVGKTIIDVSATDNKVVFQTNQGRYVLHHDQDCCESVYLDDINGSFEDLIGQVVVVAEEATNPQDYVDLNLPDYKDTSYTWTFYRIRTHKGTVVLRWYGSSNGYYSESVDFEEITE